MSLSLMLSWKKLTPKVIEKREVSMRRENKVAISHVHILLLYRQNATKLCMQTLYICTYLCAELYWTTFTR